MVKVTYMQPDGTRQSLEAPEGWSIMEAARKFAVPGIVAECGGGATCSTCHVIIDAAWTELVGPPNEIEAALLEIAPGSDPARSRLSCQVVVTSAFDGIIVHVPTEQYES